MFYLYILYSRGSDKFYVGSSEDPWQRLEHHNEILDHSYTSKHRPWELRAIFKAGNTRGAAQKMEYFIKRQKGRTLIEKLIDPEFEPGGRLAQLVRVPYVRD